MDGRFDVVRDLLRFEVRLAVQVFGFDEALAFSKFARSQQDEVCREEAVLVDFDEVACVDVFPVGPHELFVSVHEALLGVFLIVGLVPFVVFEGIFDHGQEDDESEGGQDRRDAVGDGDVRDHLQDAQKQKVQVGDFHELLDEIQWQESDERIFRGGDRVVSEEGFRSSDQQIAVPRHELFALGLGYLAFIFGQQLGCVTPAYCWTLPS